MHFPLDVTVEIEIDSVFTDITEHVYVRDGIRISRGTKNEGAQVQASSLSLTLNNRDGRYSPRNPTSPYFGKLGRNTPIRVGVGADNRFHGEVSNWPQSWEPTGTDVWTPIEAAGILRRLGQGAAPIPTAPRTYLPTTSPTVYWPLEDGSLSVTGEPLVGTSKMTLRNVTAPEVWGQGALAPWLQPTLKLTGVGPTSHTANASFAMPDFVDTWTVDLMRSGGTGDLSRTFVTLGWEDPFTNFTGFTFDGNDFSIDVFFGSLLGTITVPELFDANAHHLRLTARQDGADIDYDIYVDGVLRGTITQPTKTLQSLYLIRTTASLCDALPYAVGHIAAWADPPLLADAVDAAFGHSGETAGNRISRLCSENGILFGSIGTLADTAAMGPQGPKTLLELLNECQQADLGTLNETRFQSGFTYITRDELYNVDPQVTINYPDGIFASTPEPVDDDKDIQNRITAKREDGSDFTIEQLTGPLSTQPPPDGVGIYDTEVTVNLVGDGFLPNHASWRLLLGTVDEARYPRLHVNLAAPAIQADPNLTSTLISAFPGFTVMRLTNLPSWLPPDDVDVLVLGYSETIEPFAWNIDYTTVPYSPYRVAIYGDTVGADPSKYDTAGSALAFATDATSVFLGVASTVLPIWTIDDNEFPFDIYVGGERVTVTDITGTNPADQSFAVIRSVNGVMKAHLVGTPVRLWNTPRYGL